MLPLRQQSTRTVAGVLAGVSLLAAACATGGQPAAATTGPAAATATPAPGATATPVPIPDTLAGRQLRWFLEAARRAPVPAAEIAEHFAPAFLAQVPASKINEVMPLYAAASLVRVSSLNPGLLKAVFRAEGEEFQMTLSVDAAGLVIGLVGGEVDPPPPAPGKAPASWRELDTRLKKIAPAVGFLAAEVERDGDCRTVHAVAPRQARPVGSMFKLYVLGAVARQIQAGDYSWDTRLTITPQIKSTPAGELYYRPDNSKVTVREAARYMISISDNTATDLLVAKAGKKAVEERFRAWSRNAAKNTPLLTTGELFRLKGADYPRYAREYLAAPDRRAYLERTLAKVPMSKVVAFTEPRDIETLEWFVSPEDVCRVFSGLADLARKPGLRPVAEVLSVSDAGLGLAPAKWRSTWFKGGSEVGVLAMGFLATSTAGRTYVVTAMGSDSGAALNEPVASAELISLARGAFTLSR